MLQTIVRGRKLLRPEPNVLRQQWRMLQPGGGLRQHCLLPSRPSGGLHRPEHAVLLLGQHDLLWRKLLRPLATLRRQREGDLLRAGAGRLRQWMLLFGKQVHRQRHYLLRWREHLRRSMLPQWFELQY